MSHLRKIVIYLLLSCYSFFSLPLAAQITFQKTIGISGAGYSVRQTTDGGYIIAGHTTDTSISAGGTDAILIKTNSSGSTMWIKTYGGALNDFGESVRQTADSGYILIGTTESFGAGTDDFYLIKTNPNGDTLWTKSYGGTNLERGYSVHQTNDGGYVLLGTTFGSFGAGLEDVYLIKTDSIGDTLWTKTYGGTLSDYGYSIQLTSDGGYIITGRTRSFSSGVNFDVYLIKTDSVGDTLWTKSFGGGFNDLGTSVQQTVDGGYMVAGETNNFGAGGRDFYLIKTDAFGDTLWTKTYGGVDDEYLHEIQQTQDGGYIIAGRTNGFGAGSADVYLIKTDPNGDTLWTRVYGGASPDLGYSVQQTIDGGYIISGYGFGEVYLIKTDSNGNSGCNQFSTGTTVGGTSTQLSSGAIVGSGGSVNNTSTIVNSPVIIDSVLCFFSCSLSLSITGNDASCNSSCDGSATVSVTVGGTAPYSYQWNDPGNQTDSMATGLCAGTYTITVTDSAGCTAVDSVIINEPLVNMITFQKTFGGSNSELIYSVRQTSDGGYIAAGYTMSFGAGAWDAYLVRMNSAGAILWSKTFGGIDNDFFLSVQQTLDGGFIALGHTENFGAGGEDIFLIKTDTLGVTIWTKTYGGAGPERGFCINQTVDGGYIISGMTASFGAGGYDAYLIKTDANGDTLWTRTYGGSGSERGWSVQQTNDGGYIVAGWTNSFGTGGNNDIYFIKTDSIGDTLWTKTYGGIAEEFCRTVKQTSDGGYIAVGKTESFGAGSSDIYLIKLDGSGDSVWIKTYGGNDWDAGNDVRQTSDGGYIIAAETQNSPLGNGNAYLIKTDANGDTLWTQIYGGPDGNNFFSVEQTTDGGYVAGGLITDTGATGVEVYMIKTDGNGNSGCNQLSVGKFVGNAPMFISSGGIIGSGAIVNSPSPIVSNTATVDSLLCVSLCNNLSLSITAFSASCNGTCDGFATATVSGGFSPYTYQWNDPGNQTDSVATGLCAGTYIVTITDSLGFTGIDSVMINQPPLNQITFQRTYGSDSWEFGYGIQQTTDGGYIITGSTNIFGSGNFMFDFFLLKTDSLGDTLWVKTYGGPDRDEPSSVQQTSDGGYIIAGWTRSFGNGGTCGSLTCPDIYLIKTDSLGDTLWTKVYGGLSVDDLWGHSIKQTADGGYIIVGTTRSFGPGTSNIYLIKTDASGDTLWTTTYGGTSGEHGYSAMQTSDGGYIITGSTFSYGAGDNDVYLIKTDSLGDTLWTRTYGGVDYDEAYEVQQTVDGGYILTGVSYSFGDGTADVYLIKTDVNGDTLWTKIYASDTTFNEWAYGGQQTADGGYIITGYTYSPFSGGGTAVLLIKTNSMGDTLWTRAYGDIGDYWGFSVQQTQDGGYVVCGSTNDYSFSVTPAPDVYIIKTDCEGNSGCDQYPTNIVAGGTATQIGSGAIVGSGTIVNNTATVINNPQFSVCNPCAASVITIANDTSICNGDTTTLTASGGMSYLWNTGDTTAAITVNPDSTTTYSVAITDSVCLNTITDSITVTVNSIPIVSITGDTSICPGDTAGLTANGGIFYLWNTGNTTASIAVSPSITTAYTVVVFDGFCYAVDSISVAVYSGPAINITGDSIICNGDTSNLTVTGGISYLWNTGDTTATISVAPDSTTTYSVIAADTTCPAASIDSITINVYSDPIISISGDTAICEGDNTTLTASGGTAYLWSTGDTTASITVNPTDTTNYTVNVFNGPCFAADSVIVTVQTSQLNIVNIEICTGDSVFAGGAYQTTSGTYYDTSTAANSCDSIIITNLNVSLYLTINVNTGICIGDSILLGGGYQTTSGTYYDTTASGNCDSIIITQLTVNNLPIVDAGVNITVNADSCVTLTASAGTIYIWTPPNGLSCTDCQNPLACPGQTTTYYLTIVDANGCVGSDDVTISVTPRQVIPCGDEIFVPNIFSPNGDGENDVLQVMGERFSVNIFIIYDRWGEQVFKTDNESYGWDGTYKGKIMNPAVFVYYLEVTCTDTGEKFTAKGDITLIR